MVVLPCFPRLRRWGFVVRSHSCRCVGERFGMKVQYFPHWTRAALRFTMIQRGDTRPRIAKVIGRRALLLRSGRAMVSKETVQRVGIERCQSRTEAESRPAVRTEDRVRFAHLDVDVRVRRRWGTRRCTRIPSPRCKISGTPRSFLNFG